ncbi:BTB/POZ domain-containing protein POB1 [Acorus calamus]|uniref:BTB/POZ domain-containing protein POB1 n=1 Tax=Acorus calamus TaxID=4465 RepID=A0AAV9C4X0_ACOCL|nr:BTB/POZ domain-containing protein POB1 [Acorus calamus]
MNTEVQLLVDASKKHLVAHFRDMKKSQSDIVNLSIAGLEFILSSDDILPTTEDEVCDAIIHWARYHYPKVKERREALSSLVTRFVRLPYLSCMYLRKFLESEDIDRAALSERIIDALLFNIETLQGKHALISKDFTNKLLIERPVKVLELETPKPHSVVYFNISRAECASLFAEFGVTRTQLFPIGGHMFYLMAAPVENQQKFGVWLCLNSMDKISVSFHYAMRRNPDKLFVDITNGKIIFPSREMWRYLFSTPWSTFIEENSLYFINGMLHIRASIIIDT